MMHINEIASKYGIDDVYNYGPHMGKIGFYPKFGSGKVILVTATSPTKYGEGKTTVAIGLNDALNKLNKKSIVNVREPSMGPVFGTKGGATGGGKAKILPESEINLHFTGDFYAITQANNLISASIDNEIYQGNSLNIEKVTFNRCIDLNDRALRNINLGTRDDHFDLTAASEIMAVFSLANSLDDLRRRIDDIIIGYNSNMQEVHVSSLGITDAVMALLLQAFKPNIVTTLEDNLAIVHGGPFANIACGCSSVISLKTATNLADFVVTEAGFATDAGAFKFMDIICRENKINPYAIVLVTTIRALKENGAGDLSNGIENLHAHIDNLQSMNANVVVTLNKFDEDTKEEIEFVKKYVENLNVPFAINTVFQNGGDGAIELANTILTTEEKTINQLYDLKDNLYNKILQYVKNICHGNSIDCSIEIMNKMIKMDKYKYPICVAKTQYSLSPNKNLLGYPHDFKVDIKDLKVYNGGKYIVVYLGDILTMPGLSKNPSAKEIKIEGEEIILPR